MAETNSPKPKRKPRAKQPVKPTMPKLEFIELKSWRKVSGLIKDSLSTENDSPIELNIGSWDLYQELNEEKIEEIAKELLAIIEISKNNLEEQAAIVNLVAAFVFAKSIIEHGSLEVEDSFRSVSLAIVRKKGRSITFDKRAGDTVKEEKQTFFRDQLLLEVVLSVLFAINEDSFARYFLSDMLSTYWKAELLFNDKIWEGDITEDSRLFALISDNSTRVKKYIHILISILENKNNFISGDNIVNRGYEQLQWCLNHFFQQIPYHEEDNFISLDNRKIFNAIFTHASEREEQKRSEVFDTTFSIFKEKTNANIALNYLLSRKREDNLMDFGKFILFLNSKDENILGSFIEENQSKKTDILKAIQELEKKGSADEKRKARDFYKEYDPKEFQNRVNEVVAKLSVDKTEKEEGDPISSEDLNGYITELFHFNTELGISTLVYNCADWMIMGQNISSVNIIANRIKYYPLAVIPLVNVMGGHKDPDVFREYLEEAELEKINIETETLRLFWKGDLKLPETSFLDSLKRWITGVNLRSKTYMNLISDIDDDLLQAKDIQKISTQVFKLVVEQALEEKIIGTRGWAALTLAQMSDPEFANTHHDEIERLEIEDEAHEIGECIKQNLKTHAVRYISEYIDREEDSFVQKNMITILMDMGGQAAKDAMTRAVAGTEKEREERQKMLSEYYLQPSKARSDQASKLLDDAVKSAKRTMLLLQVLNVATFAIGALMLLGGAYYAIQASDDEMWKRITGFFTALGGLGAIVTIFLKDPLNRIQIAIGDLVQIQTAFTGFIWELNLNGTYIQSQYVAEGILTDFDIKQTVKRIDEAMDKSMHLIEQFTAEKGPEKPAYLTQLLPINGGLNSSITLLGQNLKSEDVPRRKVRYQVGINHQPTTHGYNMWSENQVVFQLNPELLDQYVGYQPDVGEVVWLSVFINGQETNALPFRIGEQQAGGYTNDTGGSWASGLVSSFGGLNSLKSFLVKNQKDLPEDFDLRRLLEGTAKPRSLTKEKEGSEEKLATNNETVGGNNLGNFGKS